MTLITLEQAILGAALLKPNACRYVAGALTPEHFEDPRHAFLFECIAALVGTGTVPDFIALTEILRRENTLERAGGWEYIDGLAMGIATAANARLHCAQLEDQSGNRRRQIILDRMGAGILSTQEGTKALWRIEQGPGTDEGVLDGSGLSNAAWITYEDRRALAEQGRAFPGLDSGFSGINHAFGGLCPGELTLLAARPSVGKSTLALQIALHVALQEQRPVAFFSLEMTEGQIADRMASILAGTSPERQRMGHLTDDERVSHAEALVQLARLPLKAYFRDYALAQVCGRIERAHESDDAPALWIIDHLHKMDLSRCGDRRHEQLNAAADALARLSKDLNVHVLLLSQLNRQCEDRPDKRPQSSDLREGGGLEEHAVNLCMLYRPGRYPDLIRKQHSQAARAEMERAVEFLIEKARFGPTGSEEAAWDPERALFENATPWMPERPEPPPNRYERDLDQEEILL